MNIRIRRAVGNDDESDEEENADDVENFFYELRTTVISNANLERVHFLMKQTTKYRSRLMADPSTDLLDMFRYFFTHPVLVIMFGFVIISIFNIYGISID